MSKFISIILFKSDYERENYEDDFEKGKTAIVTIATLLIYLVSLETSLVYTSCCHGNNHISLSVYSTNVLNRCCVILKHLTHKRSCKNLHSFEATLSI